MTFDNYGNHKSFKFKDIDAEIWPCGNLTFLPRTRFSINMGLRAHIDDLSKLSVSIKANTLLQEKVDLRFNVEAWMVRQHWSYPGGLITIKNPFEIDDGSKNCYRQGDHIATVSVYYSSNNNPFCESNIKIKVTQMHVFPKPNSD
jgi:hypothetical protein